MFYRLKETQGSVKLNPDLGVFHRGLQQPFTGADHVCRDNGLDRRQGMADGCSTGTRCGNFNSVNMAEIDMGLVAGQVDDAIGLDGHAGSVAVDVVQANASRGAGTNQQAFGFTGVLDKPGTAVEFAGRHAHICIFRLPRTRFVSDGQGHGRACGDVRQQAVSRGTGAFTQHKGGVEGGNQR